MQVKNQKTRMTKMNKKLCTILYLLISSIVNIVTLLGIVILLILGSTALLRYVIELPDGHQAYTLVMLVSLVLGFVISFLLNQKLALKIINKFNLESKFEEKWLGKKAAHKSQVRILSLQRKPICRNQQSFLKKKNSNVKNGVTVYNTARHCK